MLRLRILIVAICFVQIVVAREGMWLPNLVKALNASEMQSMGMRLSAEDIYSINNSSLKDAIVHFGGGCTAEVISKEGLILTNHHCGYSQIQSHSSVENDYLKDGFWAKDKPSELKCPGLTATFVVRIDDVTSLVLKDITKEMSPDDARQKRNDNIKRIVHNAVKGTHFKAEVKPFFYGNEYYMFTTETYHDVRMVGAPPSSIGKFGGDTDNWVWPRHTGDFSIFRIYADKNNKPAEPSEANIPYSPKRSLKISMDGVKEGDFAMVYGFPGRTSQYLTSFAVDYVVNKSNAAKIKMRDESLKIINATMAKSDTLRIKYASVQSRISNAHKKWIGQNIGLKKKNALKVKKDLEQKFTKKVKGDSELESLLSKFEKVYAERNKFEFAHEMFIEFYVYGPSLLKHVRGFRDVVLFQDNIDDKEWKQHKDKLSALWYFKNTDAATERQLLTKLLELYLQNVDPTLRPSIEKVIDSKFKGSCSAYVDYIYKKSAFTNPDKMNKLVKSFSRKKIAKLKKDPAFQLWQSVTDKLTLEIWPETARFDNELEELMKVYVKALMTHFPNRTYFSDANFTLRLTYGKVEGSKPRDGMNYTYYTTLEGIMDKHNTGHADFEIPEKLKVLYDNKDYGKYADKDGSLHVCFTSSNHTTGGNSGSPALDGNGNLIGLNFDRSWESTMSDIMFNEDLCRNIMVDIRYVLFVVDKYANAAHLVDEMELVWSNGQANFDVNELKSEIITLSNKINHFPGETELIEKRAKALVKIGRYKEAMADYETLCRKFPDNMEFCDAIEELRRKL